MIKLSHIKITNVCLISVCNYVIIDNNKEYKDNDVDGYDKLLC